MQYASPLPITAFAEIAQVKDYAQTLDQAGFDYTATSGHVLGQPSGTNKPRPDRQYVGPFYDPIVTFSFLAGVTQRLRFLTSILILPAWPTVLVAKQAAELALFSGGRFELGVGLSWNPAEYRALGQSISDRGRRIEEQVTVLRKLWSDPFVTFHGTWHTLDNLGINRPNIPSIPIWFGSETGDTALRRVARLADGWMAMGDPRDALPRLLGFIREAGRDAATFRVRATLEATDEGDATWIAAGKALQAAGVTMLNLTAPAALPPTQALNRLIAARTALRDAIG